MQRVLIGLVIIVAMLVMISCDNASSPLAPENSGEGDNSLGKKGGKSSGSSQTSTCNVEGTFAGYNETDGADYSTYEYALWAGKHNDAGSVSITNDAENIYVTYSTNETADLGEVHVYIWTDASSIPSKRPAPGHADYVMEDINADEVTVTIPADIACGGTFYISTHAALVGDGDNAGETAYAGDVSSPDCFDATKGAWWGYVNYTVECFYDLSVALVTDGDMDCFSYSTLTINGDEISSLENQTSGFEYEIVATAYDLEGNVLASETVSGVLNANTEESLTLGGWTCPVEECSDCLDGELVANGSFEDGTPGSGPPLPGWTHSGVSGYGGNSIDWGNWTGAASDGAWVIDLVGTGTPAQGMQPGSVEQVLCTEPGEEYVLTFDVRTNGSAALLVTIDGNSQTFSSSGSYTSYSVAFTASASTTTIRLAADASWHYLYNNVFLDNVSISCGPAVCTGNIVVNGDFETAIPGGLEGWSLSNVDYGTWTGSHTVDLIGTPGSGTVSQYLPTVIGTDYELTFEVIANGPSIGPKEYEVEVAGVTQTFTIAQYDASVITETVAFTATSTSTYLRFTGKITNDNRSGTFLDNVTVCSY